MRGAGPEGGGVQRCLRGVDEGAAEGEEEGEEDEEGEVEEEMKRDKGRAQFVRLSNK